MLFQIGTQISEVGARVLACMAFRDTPEARLRVSPPPAPLSEGFQSHLCNVLNSSSLDLACRSKDHHTSSLSFGAMASDSRFMASLLCLTILILSSPPG